MEEPRATLLLCDQAQTVDGKLYVLGGGWNRIKADTAVHIAVAAVFHIPYDRTNTPTRAELAVLDEDGDPYPDGDNKSAPGPVRVEAKIEVGRPPGMRKGEESNVPLSLRLDGIRFRRGGYRVEARVDGEVIATLPFTAVERL